MRDHLLMIEQFELMRKEKILIRKQKIQEAIEKEKLTQNSRAIFPAERENNTTESVL